MKDRYIFLMVTFFTYVAFWTTYCIVEWESLYPSLVLISPLVLVLTLAVAMVIGMLVLMIRA